jgi:hypothetical protein
MNESKDPEKQEDDIEAGSPPESDIGAGGEYDYINVTKTTSQRRDDKISLPDSESTTVEPIHSIHTQRSVLERYHSRISRIDSKHTFIDFAHGDPDNPLNFSTLRKWFITALAVIMTVLCAAAAGAYSPVMPNLMEEFGASSELVTLGISLYPFGCALPIFLFLTIVGIGPLVLAPLSELQGRNPVYFVTLFITTSSSLA